MSLPKIVLETEKTTPVYGLPLRIRQGDKGDALEVLLGKSFVTYPDLTDIDVTLIAERSDQTLIKAAAATKNGNTFSVTLPDAMYVKPGVFRRVYFKIGDDSTSDIKVEVLSGTGSSSANGNYIQDFEDLLDQAMSYVYALNSLAGTYDAVIDKKIVELTAKMTSFVAKASDDLEAAKQSYSNSQVKSELDSKNQRDDFDTKFNSLIDSDKEVFDGLASDYSSKIQAADALNQSTTERFDKQADNNKAALEGQAKDFESRFVTQNKIFEDRYTNQKNDFDSEVANKITEFETDYVNFKSGLSKDVEDLQTQITNSGIEADQLEVKLKEINDNLATVDFTNFVTKKDLNELETSSKEYADSVGVASNTDAKVMADAAESNAIEHSNNASAKATSEANKYTDLAITNLTSGDAGELLTEQKGNELYAKVDVNGDLLIDDKILKANETGELEYNSKKLLMAVVPTAPIIELGKAVVPNEVSYSITPPKNLGGSELRYYTISYKLKDSTDWTSKDVSDLTGSIDNLAEFGTCQFKVSVTTYAGSSDYSEIKEVRLVDNRIFGVSWDRKSSPDLTRTDSSIGWVAGINGDKNDFDNADLYKGIHDAEDDLGNFFVRVPKCYIKKTQTGEVDNGLATWQISLGSHGEGWYLPKCFWDFKNEEELDYVDVGKYNGSNVSSKLVSKSDLSPAVSTTFTDFRKYALNNGTGYQLLDIHTVDLLQVLFTIEFATLNSQSIMKGHTDDQSSALKSGDSNGHLGSSGNNSEYGAMNYRGIENLWGNLYQAVDGVNFSGGNIWVCDDSTKYQSGLLASPYQKVGYSKSTSSAQYTNALGFDNLNPYAQFPTSYGGDSQTYYSDQYYYASGTNVAYFGSYYNQSVGNGGLWFWYSYCSASDSYANYGCRLLKKALL